MSKNEWLPIPRASREVPFGYKVSPNNEKVLLPIALELDHLEEAKDHIKKYSLREVAEWLTVKTGRSISYVGLKKRIESEAIRNYKSRTVAKWAKAAKEKQEEAERLVSEHLGARKPKTDQLSFDFGEDFY